MRVGPSIVIGLGSSGCYVVSNLERILYEVLSDTPLDMFRFISIDTDTTRKEDEPPPGGRRGVSISAYEKNLGQAIHDLKHILKDDFNWCPPDLRISGPGAGNLRAGGRVLLFNKLPDVWNLIKTETVEVKKIAGLPQTEQRLQAELTKRGINVGQGIVDPQAAVVYVVGTLAGGTCSGMCVDLGYLIHDAAPGFDRVGIFFIPDRSSGPVFLHNTWAALKDLEYFCDNPADYRAMWPTANQTAQPYMGGVAVPYDQTYLLSTQDQDRQFRLTYRPDSRSPLVVMASMQLALDLLGMYQHRAAKLSNINTHVPGPRKLQMFLNYSLRAVSYPKYEISEAAACKVAAETVCAGWLDEKYHDSSTGRTPLKEEGLQAEGRQKWNVTLGQVWGGARGTVNLGEWVDKLREGNLARPADDLMHQFSGNVAGTIFSHIAHQMPGRVLELKRLVKSGIAQKFEQTSNIKAAELYLAGVRQELEHTQRYWNKLGVPTSRDDDAWAGVAREMVDRIFVRKGWLAARTINQARDLLRHELEELCIRLQIYLMQPALADFRNWIETDMAAWLRQLRTMVETVQTKARSRHDALVAQLANFDPPVLRLSRSKAEGFADEIRSLAERKPAPREPLLRINTEGEFEGLFAIQLNRDIQDNNRLHGIFVELKDMLQPDLLRALESKGQVNIVSEIADQDRVPQAANLLQETLDLSIATKVSLLKAHGSLASFVVAKDQATASALLDRNLRRYNPDLPPMTAVGLPMFDHMAIFYQEGARMTPDDLYDAEILRKAYEDRLEETTPENVDPLRPLKKQVKRVEA
jgi:hypothetical protein